MTDNIHPYLQEYEVDAAITYRAKLDKNNEYNRNYMKTYYSKADGEEKRIKRRLQNKIWYRKKRTENPIFCTPCNKYIQNPIDHNQRIIHINNQELYDAKLAKEAIEKEKLEMAKQVEEASKQIEEAAKQIEEIVIEKKKLELKIDTMTIKPLEIIYESKKSKYSPRNLFSPRRSFA